MAELISHDGRPYRDTPAPNGPSPPLAGSTTPLITDFLGKGAAERDDLLLRPPAPGQYRVTLTWQH